MRVLIGCEESGKVRDAFQKLGHDAWSNDLLPTRQGIKHLQCDVFEAMAFAKWDIIILHPDCTALSLSGNGTYGAGKEKYHKRIEAIEWTIRLWEAAKFYAVHGCALENPTSVIWQHLGKPQYIQPYQYGHGETKKTGILLHNLPELIPTNIVDGREQRIWKMAPSPNRKRDRAETYQGIADAMASQWGRIVY